MAFPAPGDQAAASRPLHDLTRYEEATVAEAVPVVNIDYPFANDESATQYIEAADRQRSPGYRAAGNRTALLAGEGALAAALPFIPEDTVVLADIDPNMRAYMHHYVEALRSARNPAEWKDQMGDRLREIISCDEHHLQGWFQSFMTYSLDRQVRHWHAADVRHPLADDGAYELASELARQKALIPWEADLTSAGSMTQLGTALRRHAGVITMFNLTNVFDIGDPGPKSLALDELPATPDALVLASSHSVPPNAATRDLRAAVVPSEGSFPGVGAYRRHLQARN